MTTKKKALVIIFIYVTLLVIFWEIGARSYYAVKKHISFFSPVNDLVYIWYPELKALDKYNYDANAYNILLLGGSVLTTEFGNVPGYMVEKFGAATGKKVNLVNLAGIAHSSLDSYYKYTLARNKRFDLVIVYHGINEARANCIPPEFWRKDYSHYSWYKEINFYFNTLFLRRLGLLLPYNAKHILVEIDKKLVHKDRYSPKHLSQPQWLEYGRYIKTRESFQENLSKIISIAKEKKEPLMLMTFAYYMSPSDKEAFTTLWGKPKYVALAIETHNSVIKELAHSQNSIFLDQEELMGGKKEYFKDICHFTDTVGSETFAENILAKARDAGILRK